MRVRLTKDDPAPRTSGPATAPATFRGLTERQWFICLLVAAGLLLLITFRGCIIPSGVGPKNKVAVGTTPTPAASAQAAGTEYTVKAGDNLAKIARDNNVSLEALAAANNINLNQRVNLRIGQKLTIPVATPAP
jgi:LysM repeat protein